MRLGGGGVPSTCRERRALETPPTSWMRECTNAQIFVALRVLEIHVDTCCPGKRAPHEKRAAALARTHLHDFLGDLDVTAAAADGAGDVML